MTVSEFIKRIDDHEDLWLIGMDNPAKPDSPGMYVKHEPTGFVTRVPTKYISIAKFDVIVSICCHKIKMEDLQEGDRICLQFKAQQ